MGFSHEPCDTSEFSAEFLFPLEMDQEVQFITVIQSKFLKNARNINVFFYSVKNDSFVTVGH